MHTALVRTKPVTRRLPDLDEVRTRLRAHLDNDADLDALSLDHVKVGKRGPKLFLFQYPDGDGHGVLLSARNVAREKGPAQAAQLNQQSMSFAQNPLESTAPARAFYEPELGLLFQSFPLDRKLPGLEIAASGSRLAPLLEQLLSARTGGARILAIDVQTMRYKPERKCTLRYRVEWDRPDVAPAVLYGKVAREKNYTLTRGLLDRIESAARGTGLCVPEALGDLPDLRLEFFTEVPGVPLANLAGSEQFPAHCARSAELLHRFHALPVTAGEPWGTDAKLDRLAEDTAGMMALRPGQGSTVRALERRIADALRAVAVPGDTLIHRDFHGTNVLVSENETALIDLEDCAMGDPAEDIGSMCANLDLMALMQPDCATAIRSARRAFLEAYPHAGRMHARISANTAMYCFMLAFQRLRHPHARHYREHADVMLANSASSLDAIVL